MAESDYVELRASTGEMWRLIERDDGWWVFEGALEDWGFSKDADHGFVTSMDPPGGPHTALGSVLITARGRRLVVASILMKGRQLKVILMPEE
jgi:hypothetical protein